MRTIRFYKIGDKAWLSPTRYLSAILSGEELTAVDHGPTDGLRRAIAILHTWDTILNLLRASLWLAWGGLLYSAAFLLILFYPPLIDQLSSGVHGVMVIFIVLSGFVSLYSILKNSITRIILAWKRRNLPRLALPVRNGPPLDPPWIAHKAIDVKKPSVSIPMMVLVVALLLNSIILATPLRPAIVGNALYEGLTLVLPGTYWRAVQRYPTDEAFHYFYYDGYDLIGVYIFYSAEQLDLFQPTSSFRNWMQSYLSAIVNSASNQIAVGFSPDMSDDERKQAYIDWWSDPDIIAELTLVLTSGFNSRYDKIMRMRGLEVSVRTISINQYRNMMNDDE
jgi:hypothetical protein